jgi:hypothetical protein
LKEVEVKGKVARINYLKSYGPDAPPGWVIGIGRIEGMKFLLEEEFVARHLIINAKAFGMVGIQKRGEESYDRLDTRPLQQDRVRRRGLRDRVTHTFPDQKALGKVRDWTFIGFIDRPKNRRKELMSSSTEVPARTSM